MKKPPAKRTPAPVSLPAASTDAVFARIVTILEEARTRVARTVNSEIVLAYWHIGREIVEEVQQGAARADYGEAVIDSLSQRLTQRFGPGFSGPNVRNFRQFYITYSGRRPEIRYEPRSESGAGPSPEIHHEPRSELVVAGSGDEKQDDRDVSATLEQAVAQVHAERAFSPDLSWTHYRALMRVEHGAERLFYEIEAARERWSTTVLERQIHTHLFLRLLKSRDKAGVLALATEGQALGRPIDAMREPYILDFLAIPDGGAIRETGLETAIIEKIQHFLLELGKGFAFVARQKRLEYEDDCFYVDLVFYNCILKCYLLIDLKMGKLTHQDVGQMDSYVRLYDDRYTSEGDNPTIGLILCAQKNDTVARYSVLHESEQLFAARYLTYLPTVEELQAELQRERRLIESRRKEE